ncbi:hypothetical protein DEU56DRAFT_802902 [Suillus clintonianus]|uniref:uncharacterized protein n=1 Tax=Suillus clintonianus TaxID=1904413 RepID=UPI001B8846A9|nr:uncharacterized protein DEU56DRAFT_802902 [Suillus clintonianus]KAG2138379.1 hypothetical protein DEU56DRAFT_802902 [Suillus clintonianus]
MLIRLVPSLSHGTVLYNVSFPANVPNLPTPPAWSNQLHLLTSVLCLESPQNIHVFDRSVGLVARITEVVFDVPSKEVVVSFVGGRAEKLPMNSQCMQMLQGVVDDVKTCSEQESRRDSFERATSASICSSVTSSQEIPSASSAPPKSPKLSRHKKQRSLLFSLISSLVPRSLSPPPAPPPSPTTPYPSSPAPLPPIPPITPRNASISPIPQSPISPYNSAFPPLTDPPILRRRARATLIDAWRRHVVPALSAHNLYAGYIEWVLRGMAIGTRSEVREIERSWQHRDGPGRGAARKHGRTQSEGRAALDFGQRGSEEIQRRWRAPSPFPDEVEGEHDDCVVYPRHEQAHEWGAIRHVRNPSACDELDAYAFEFSVENGSLLRESFGFGTDAFGDVWDDDDHVNFDHFGSLRPRTEFTFDDGQLNFDEGFGSDYEGGDYLVDNTFAVTPSDATEEDESDESQTSILTPEDGEVLPLPLPATLPGLSKNGACFQQRSHSDSVPTAVSKTTSSRPKNRPLHSSPGFSSTAPDTCSKPSSPTTAAPWGYQSPMHPQKLSSRFPSSPSRLPKRMSIPNVEELLSTRIALLSQIRSALTLVRTRAREEHWGLLWSQNSFGCGLMDPESEGQLEIRARRRAWSAGIKVSAASAPTLFSASIPGSSMGARVWDGSVPSTAHFLNRPPGLTPPVTKLNGPILPPGLLLGRPIKRSPLSMYVWSVDDVAKRDTARPSKYGDIGLKHSGETAALKRPLRVSFLESPTKLLPVREEGDDDVGSSERRTSKIDFPQSPTSPTSPVQVTSVIVPDERFGASQGDVSATDDPFFCSPYHARARTTSMYPCSQPSQELPMFRPRTPPPSYQAATGDDNTDDDEESDNGSLDACALLFQPLSTLCLTSPTKKTTPTRPPLVTSLPFTPRVRAVSLPACPVRPRSPSLSSRSNDEECQDLSQAYAAPPPPATAITAAPTIAVTESYLTYAHLHAPVPICGTASVTHGMCEKSKGIASREVVFERNGEEYMLGLEVALGRAEEGRSVW